MRAERKRETETHGHRQSEREKENTPFGLYNLFYTIPDFVFKWKLSFPNGDSMYHRMAVIRLNDAMYFPSSSFYLFHLCFYPPVLPYFLANSSPRFKCLYLLACINQGNENSSKFNHIKCMSPYLFPFPSVSLSIFKLERFFKEMLSIFHIPHLKNIFVLLLRQIMPLVFQNYMEKETSLSR